MAYNTEDLTQEALEVIEREELVFFNEIEHYISACKTTLETHGLDKMGIIKDALSKNKISAKKELRNKWMNSDNATTQIALYKLLGEDTELKALSGQHVDHTSGGDKLSIVINKNYESN